MQAASRQKESEVIMRTVDEKFKYNEQRGGDFGNGYCFAVTLYREYSNLDRKGKAIVKRLIGQEKELARYSDMQRSKGFMCGIRDAANERKARK